MKVVCSDFWAGSNEEEGVAEKLMIHHPYYDQETAAVLFQSREVLSARTLFDGVSLKCSMNGRVM